MFEKFEWNFTILRVKLYEFGNVCILNCVLERIAMYIWGNLGRVGHLVVDRILGHKGQLAPRCRAQGTMILSWYKKFYHGIQKAVHPFRFKNFEHLLGSGGGGGTTI